MVRATVATQHQQRIGNMSFPRTPNSGDSHSHYNSQASSPHWFSCNSTHIQTRREKDNDNTHSPAETVHHYSMQGHESFANGRRRRQMRLQAQNNNSLGTAQQQPNYPTTIEVRPSRTDQVLFKGESYTQRLCRSKSELEDRDERLSLDDSFGFDDNTNSDALFEILYHELDEEDGTLQSSIDLNPYSPKDFVSQGKWNNSSAQIAPCPVSDVEKTLDKKYTNVISPTVAMNRRRSSKSTAHHRTAVISPTSSVFTTPDPITCANTSSVLRRTNTGVSNTPTRNRSTSRSHRSCSRSAPRHCRSRSRSTSVARNKTDYNSNVFRGAALVRDQLLRSMLSADCAMDEAKREFNEELIERGGRRQAMRNKKFAHNGSSDISSDYKADCDLNDGGTTSSRNVSTPSRNSGRIATTTQGQPACAASQDSSEFETESRRVDNLIGILQSTSFASGSNADSAFKSLLSNTENDVRAHPDTSTPETETVGLLPNSVSAVAASSEVISLCAESPKQFDTTETENKVSLVNNHPKHSTAVVDEALAHAQNAGPLWRSLVGNHVRLPSKWNEILPPSSPTVHSIDHKWSKWYYVARHRVKGDKRLNSREFGVRSRRSGGRILLRLVIREVHSQQVCREIAVGCFHPNSKGIRKGDPLPETEDVREVWMAVRWVMDIADNVPTLCLRTNVGDNGYEGVVDCFLMQKRDVLDSSEMGSALGHRKAVSNDNVRAVLGDQPPLTTVDLNEDEFADVLKANGAMKLAVLPALMILKLFLFSKK